MSYLSHISTLKFETSRFTGASGIIVLDSISVVDYLAASPVEVVVR